MINVEVMLDQWTSPTSAICPIRVRVYSTEFDDICSDTTCINERDAHSFAEQEQIRLAEVERNRILTRDRNNRAADLLNNLKTEKKSEPTQLDRIEEKMDRILRMLNTGLSSDDLDFIDKDLQIDEPES